MTQINEETLKNWYKSYKPGGSVLMRVICDLIEVIAHDRGYNIKEWK